MGSKSFRTYKYEIFSFKHSGINILFRRGERTEIVAQNLNSVGRVFFGCCRKIYIINIGIFFHVEFWNVHRKAFCRGFLRRAEKRIVTVKESRTHKSETGGAFVYIKARGKILFVAHRSALQRKYKHNCRQKAGCGNSGFFC